MNDDLNIVIIYDNVWFCIGGGGSGGGGVVVVVMVVPAYTCNYGDVTWASWCLTLRATRLFQQLIRASIKRIPQNIKAPHY